MARRNLARVRVVKIRHRLIPQIKFLLLKSYSFLEQISRLGHIDPFLVYLHSLSN
jgi:hypothetical protein